MAKEPVGRAGRQKRCLTLLLVAALPLASSASPPSDSHPLMPGIRSAELWNANWPRALHDKLATGFSPLICGMKESPRIWGEFAIAGQLHWLEVLPSESQGDRLLISDGALHILLPNGQKVWSGNAVGRLLFHGDLRGDGEAWLLMGAGPQLALLNATSGELVWSHTFEPAYVDVRVRVADILPEKPGLEAAVFFKYGEEGVLLSFPPDREPEIVWQKPVVIPGEFQERYDHGCDIELDLSDPTQPIIWNVRRFRARGFDARTGEMLSTLEYEIGGEKYRRNYGPWVLGKAKNGDPLAVVVSEQVQLHAHAIRLKRTGRNELAWEHYYGEVYKEPGVAIQLLGVADLDGDAVSDLVYTVRDPARNYRCFVRIRDAETGVLKHELADRWGAMLLVSAGKGQASALLTFVALDGATPTEGELEVYALNPTGEPTKLTSLDRAKLVRPRRGASGASPLDVLVSRRTVEGLKRVERYTWNSKKAELELRAVIDSSHVVAHDLQAVLRDENGDEAFALVQTDGKLVFRRPNGTLLQEHVLQGAGPPVISAVDLNNDGHAELMVLTPQGHLQIVSWDNAGVPKCIEEHAHVAAARSPVAYDLLGDATPELITIAPNGEGRLNVSARNLDREPCWESELDFPVDDLQDCAVNVGQFLGPNHAGVAVSLLDAHRIHEGTYLLDGRTGEKRWFKDRYRNGNTIMPYRPGGTPTSFDVDGDGIEEIGMDLLSYMAYLRGSDGSFAYVRHTGNTGQENPTFAGLLYNTFCPIYASAQATRPHWMVTGGFGPLGLMNPDVIHGVWRVNYEYDNPPNIGMIDVDGDGQLEVGYAVQNDRTFICRDIWTGNVKWELELPSSSGPIITADVDGDGQGEFLIGGCCVGENGSGRGELRWQTAHAFGLIADFDGDGRGEIACPESGRVVILRATDTQNASIK